MIDPIRIRGGAGPHEAAAIAAAVVLLLAEESARMAVPEGRPELSPWVSTGRSNPPDRPSIGGAKPSGFSAPLRR